MAYIIYLPAISCQLYTLSDIVTMDDAVLTGSSNGIPERNLSVDDSADQILDGPQVHYCIT